MTTFEACTQIAQTILMARGEWCVDGIDETLRNDIKRAAHTAAGLLRLEDEYTFNQVQELTIQELERRATPWYERSPIIP